jgi:hypothetical protein
MEDGSLFEPEMVMPFRADVMGCTYIANQKRKVISIGDGR